MMVVFLEIFLIVLLMVGVGFEGCAIVVSVLYFLGDISW